MSYQWLERISGALSRSGQVAYVWDMGADRLEWAGDMHRILGLAVPDCPRSSSQFHRLINPQEVPARLSALHGVIRSRARDEAASFSMTYKLRRSDGRFVQVEESATVQRDGKDGSRLVYGFIRQADAPQAAADHGNESSASGTVNVSAFVQRPAKAEEVTDHGSRGRGILREKVGEALDMRGGRTETLPFGYFMVVGIDRMSLFNDVMGPRHADEILEKTGQRLRQICGEAGFVARLDGDVYGLLFRQGPHNEMAAVAKYILNNFYNVPVQLSVGPIGVRISIGGVTLDRSNDAASIITMAEMAMHVAKDKGRSCFVSYDEASHKAEDNRRLLKSGDVFLKAMKDNRLRLAFQPVMDAQSRNASFHECLMRLIDERGNVMPAGAFIPAIEQLGLSRLVDQHALRMAIAELEMFPGVELSVNVSNLTLNNHDWLRSIVAALRDRPSVAQRLIIEITESAVIADLDSTKRIVRTLKDLGCRVALDDFGAGYTAFSQLKDLKVDIVKIDKSFVRNIDDAHNHLFVRTLQSLADGVKIKTVGEGAETLAEANLLASDGVNLIQGYVFGFPRIERLWLPKDHAHRLVAAPPEGEIDAGSPPAVSAAPPQQTDESSLPADIAAAVKAS